MTLTSQVQFRRHKEKPDNNRNREWSAAAKQQRLNQRLPWVWRTYSWLDYFGERKPLRLKKTQQGGRERCICRNWTNQSQKEKFCEIKRKHGPKLTLRSLIGKPLYCITRTHTRRHKSEAASLLFCQQTTGHTLSSVKPISTGSHQ